MNNNFHIGWCPFCNQGWIDIEKDTLDGKFFLLCQECDTTWDSPIDFKQGKLTNIKPLGKLEIPLLSEIQQLGWDKWLVSLDDTL
ncbi:MAG TPA: hypothetical protein VFE54_05575 [Mucilaginibacter sp.]|jgi:hypothetical protein|nr:hypothetical protein [Mucilaginibacter sp.]